MSYSEDFTSLTAQPVRAMRAKKRFDPETSPFVIEELVDGSKIAVLKEEFVGYGGNHTASFIVEWGSTIRRDAYLLIEVARKFRDKTHEMLQAAAQKVPTLYQLASEQRLTQIINDANDANRTEPITPRSVRIDVFHDLFPEYKSIDRMTRPRKYTYQRKSTRNFKHSR